MKKYFQKQGGFTLLEVLLSIVLLSIILTSFLGFFTQSASFAKKNQYKLNTIQTAQKIVNLIELNVTKQDLIENNIIDGSGFVISGKKTLNQIDIENLIEESTGHDYNIEATVTNNSAENLIMFKIVVQNPASPGNTSETYTYIRR
ncbi:prepilin-type N-terminal cleavage/methylation domain-containing protein [Neobacillus sp. YIM B06451]|uniref:type IV pilus modification PilV family protein n=1 Tax=Neobacillus sp. YIM B06451 TaxID=3070994 RepID=UPI00292CC358|nr:prepilin-type N-terminal cleavage/methylation domain-containing protein [Neobacillus sp. YIM B06451]